MSTGFKFSNRYRLIAITLIFAVAAFGFGGCSFMSDDAAERVAPKVQYSETKTISAEGGVLSSSAHNVGVLVTPFTLKQSSEIEFKVMDSQFSEVVKDGFYFSPNGIVLSIDPLTMDGIGQAPALAPAASGAQLQAAVSRREMRVKIPFNGSFDSQLQPLFIAQNQDGFFVPVDFEVDTASSALIGLIDTEEINALMEGVNGKLVLKIYSANLIKNHQDTASQITASVKQFKNTNFVDTPIPDLTGKRVAVTVHGIMSKMDDVKDLSSFLSSFKKSGNNYYDYVISFGYSSNARISDLGAKMAEMVYPLVKNAAEVDVFAHSMGNLVSRYAISSSKIPNRLSMVKHYVALGGPHEGVPLADMKAFNVLHALGLLFGVGAIPCVEDLLTYTKDLVPFTVFLRDLNDFSATGGVAPEYKTMRVYSMAGQTYQSFTMTPFLIPIKVGKIFNYMYENSVKNSGVKLVYKIDGIVADYSAQTSYNKALDKMSEFHKTTPNASVTFPELNHGELSHNIKAFNQISDWMNNYWQ